MSIFSVTELLWIRCNRVSRKVTGTLGFRLQASQTLVNPLIQFTATARDIRATERFQLIPRPAAISAIRDRRQSLGRRWKVSATGYSPSWTERPDATGRRANHSDRQYSLTILRSVLFTWPDNNLAFVRKIVPDIKVVEGRVGMDVSVNGTIKKPDLAGSIQRNSSRGFKPGPIRFPQSPTFPRI